MYPSPYWTTDPNDQKPLKCKVMNTRQLLIMMVALFTTSMALAQRGPNDSDRHYSSYEYDDHYGYDYRSDTREYDWYYGRMSRPDRRRLTKLINRVEERKRCAWEDGHLSRKDRRRIDEARADLDDHLYRFERSRRYQNRNRVYRNDRNRRYRNNQNRFYLGILNNFCR